ncbi:hypothetical protein B484DRAFT_399203, partial [Ochromonadaceae sp. CCMP2298]
RTLAAHALRVRDEPPPLQNISHMHAGDALDSQIRTLYAVLNNIEHCKDIMHTFSELKPYRVLGVKVYYDTVTKLITTGISFFGVLFSLYKYSINNQG